MRCQLIPLSAILATAALAQSPPATLTVPPTNITSGTASYEAENAITTGGNAVNISGSASVLFQVLSTSQTTITLLPGFHAKAGSAQPTFKALIGPLAGTPTQISGTQQVNAPQTITFTLQNTGDSNPIAGGDITFLLLDGNGNVQAQCPVELSTNSMTFWLLDTGTSSDSTCAIGSSSSMSIGSEVVTVNLKVTFLTAGTYTVTTDAIDSAGILFPFQAAGTWTVTGPTPPVISSFSPTAAGVGAPLTISGTNFGTSLGTLNLGNAQVPAANITTWTSTTIVLNVPASAASGAITVTAGNLSGSSANQFQFIPPDLTMSSPSPSALTVYPNRSPSGSFSEIVAGTNFFRDDQPVVYRALPTLQLRNPLATLIRIASWPGNFQRNGNRRLWRAPRDIQRDHHRESDKIRRHPKHPPSRSDCVHYRPAHGHHERLDLVARRCPIRQDSHVHRNVHGDERVHRKRRHIGPK